jgi:hypothetical protein
MDMNLFIRGSRRGHRPSAARRDPEQDARIRDYLTAAGEPIPAELQPPPPSDWGGGPRGPISYPREESMSDIIREIVLRKKGAIGA